MLSRKIQQVNYEGEVGKLLKKHLTNKRIEGYDLVGDEEFLMTVYYKDYMKSIDDLEIFDSDVFVASHPKTGMHLTTD